MIPFASQRAGGQDLATHLMNELDNEHIELAEVRGAIARDLHGAFAEWEALARALTRSRKYLFSLSINPDEQRGRLTRAQYLDYIERVEEALGLTGQPRAVLFHVKKDWDGEMREHAHAVWSRIDVEAGRAIPLSFFKEKLMAVTRQFARDHGISLPGGYYRQEDEPRRKNRQLSAYDGVKQKETGVTHEERMAAVTDAWKRSDSAAAFVHALEELGYILARGRNQTRLVLVDVYGHTTALTRLIDDPAVRARHVREFLGAAYAPESLPTVEQAQALAARHRQALEEAREELDEQDEQLNVLGMQQAQRREKLEAEAAILAAGQREERAQLAAEHKAARQQLKADYLAETRRIRIERSQRRPRGLAAFLGRVTGVALITKKLQRYRDRKRFETFLEGKRRLFGRQQEQWQALARRHELQDADMQRKLRAIERIEQRERETLELLQRREQRQALNESFEHLPVFAPAMKSPDEEAASGTAGPGDISALAREFAEAVQGWQVGREVRLADEFARDSNDESDEQEAGGQSSGGPEPAEEHKTKRIDLSQEFNEAAADPDDPGGGDGERARKPRRRRAHKRRPGNDRPPRPRRPRGRAPGRGR